MKLRPFVRSAVAVSSFAMIGFLATNARAHFVLTSPPADQEQDSLGMPQKSDPCGQADPGIPAVPTNVVTSVQQGTSITLTVNETIFHPGHYRVALAQDQASLPADPVVSVDGSDACGSASIDSSPTFPTLADDVFDHTSQFSGPQTIQIPIPAGMTCTNCTLQVIEFMSNHGLNNPGGCFYHHCAIVNVTQNAPADAGPISDAAGIPNDGFDPAFDAATSTGSGGGGCDASGSPANGAIWFSAMIIGAMIIRRRR